MTSSALLAVLLLGMQGSGERWPSPRTMIAIACTDTIVVDGTLTEESWQSASWSDPFVDITGDSTLNPRWTTHVALLWNATHLFVGARMEEPDVWGRLRQRDTVIFYDNDFEFFFDPDGDNHRYGEIEINALNTVWDLLLEKPYRDGGPAVDTWDLRGMRTAVGISGTVNDPSDRDSGWCVEIAIPWDDIRDLSPRHIPPSPGVQWRINFSRVEWTVRDSSGTYVKAHPREDNWVWSPMGAVNMHLPERWGVLEFRNSGEDGTVSLDASHERARRVLMECYLAGRAFVKDHGRWPSLHELETHVGMKLLPDAEMLPGTSGPDVWITYRTERGESRKAGVTSDGRLLWK